MDVSRDTIAVAVLRPGEDVPAVELISHDPEMVCHPLHDPDGQMRGAYAAALARVIPLAG